MKAIEIKYASKVKELEKLNARLERVEKALAKKQANAEKLGVAAWTIDEHNDWLATVPTTNGFIDNQEDVKKNGAWFDLFGAIRDVEEIKEKIAKAERNLNKAEKELDEYHDEIEKLADLKEKEHLYKLEFEAEQKEWAKDGITLEARYTGTTPNGKRFDIMRNRTLTTRGVHCFTLYINGNVVFTSGEFWRAYATVKNS